MTEKEMILSFASIAVQLSKASMIWASPYNISETSEFQPTVASTKCWLVRSLYQHGMHIQWIDACDPALNPHWLVAILYDITRAWRGLACSFQSLMWICMCCLLSWSCCRLLPRKPFWFIRRRVKLPVLFSICSNSHWHTFAWKTIQSY